MRSLSWVTRSDGAKSMERQGTGCARETVRVHDGERPMPKVLYEKSDRIARVTINRLEARNAIDTETHELLWSTWEDFASDDSVDVAIFSGAGEAFSSGADLKTFIPPWIQDATPRRVRDNVK